MFINADALEKLLLAAFPQYKPLLLGVDIRKINASDDTSENAVTLVFSVDRRQEIENDMTSFLNRLGASFDSVNFIFSARAQATKPAILRAIKVLQPVGVNKIQDYFSDRRVFFNEKTLHNDLDELRKVGHIIWQDGKYSVTEAALSIIPHGNSKYSSDIVRALEFKNKEW